MLFTSFSFYKLEDLVSHPAIIFFPYSVMSYKNTEFYSLSVPMFVPSPKFFASKDGLGYDRTSTTNPYCSGDPNLEVNMRPSVEAGLSAHPYSPNIERVSYSDC